MLFLLPSLPTRQELEALDDAGRNNRRLGTIEVRVRQDGDEGIPQSFRLAGSAEEACVLLSSASFRRRHVYDTPCTRPLSGSTLFGRSLTGTLGGVLQLATLSRSGSSKQTGNQTAHGSNLSSIGSPLRPLRRCARPLSQRFESDHRLKHQASSWFACMVSCSTQACTKMRQAPLHRVYDAELLQGCSLSWSQGVDLRQPKLCQTCEAGEQVPRHDQQH
mmetsp:Transcript_57330/g.152886  ORF Transcript_57330/g.152886 Transcript_57330/m.152886 type:complete len:219 (-) Transcript_57330:3506-4162(-)